jgi:tetratricopeptide (TPR) repeat protein
VRTEADETGIPRPAALRLRVAFFAASLAISLVVYRAALDGPFVSDDLLYLVNNVTVRELDRMGLPALFDPRGAATLEVGNYAPLLLLVHAAEWRVFGTDVRAYHVVNLVLHALCATLLLSLLQRNAVASGAAFFAAGFFLLHPANVEAVAWISQLKSVLALALALGALLALERHPLAATALFAAALLTKAIAAFALPMAAGLAWAAGSAGRGLRRTVWLAVWALVLALVAVPQLAASHQIGRAFAPPHPDLASQLRFVAWVGWHYLTLAATGLGTSAFHEPGPVGWLSPGWVLGLLAGLALVARSIWGIRRRRPEAAFWLGALAAFAPVSQLLPFYFALGDRYLYFILPGLLGGVALLARGRLRAAPPLLRRAGSLLAVALLVAFALLSQQRAALWRDEFLLLADSAAHYPQGGTAHFARAVVATHRGHPEAAIASLQASADRGYHFMRSFDAEPMLAPLHSREDFRSLIRDIARRQIAYAEERRFHTPPQLRGLAAAYLYLGEFDRAIEIYEQAIRQGGPLQAVLIDELHAARDEWARARTSGEAP